MTALSAKLEAALEVLAMHEKARHDAMEEAARSRPMIMAPALTESDNSTRIRRTHSTPASSSIVAVPTSPYTSEEASPEGGNMSARRRMKRSESGACLPQ
jgi:hypothetical protein